MDTVIENDKGFEITKNVFNIFEGNATSRYNKISEELSADDMTRVKFAPTTSVNRERSFSKYKTTLADSRRRFIIENIKYHK